MMSAIRSLAAYAAAVMLSLLAFASGPARAQQDEPVAAAAADLVPVAGAVAVPGVQGKMLHALAGIYGVAWDRRALGEFAAAVGTGALVRMATAFGAREFAKLIPVYGQTAGAAAAAAASFATTYALGKAACHFLARRRSGASDPDGVAAAYRESLADAFRLARSKGLDKAHPPAAADLAGTSPDKARGAGHG